MACVFALLVCIYVICFVFVWLCIATIYSFRLCLLYLYGCVQLRYIPLGYAFCICMVVYSYDIFLQAIAFCILYGCVQLRYIPLGLCLFVFVWLCIATVYSFRLCLLYLYGCVQLRYIPLGYAFCICMVVYSYGIFLQAMPFIFVWLCIATIYSLQAMPFVFVWLCIATIYSFRLCLLYLYGCVQLRYIPLGYAFCILYGLCIATIYSFRTMPFVFVWLCIATIYSFRLCLLYLYGCVQLR